jgi:exodeoxyribonuclease VII large subunit
LAAQLDALSPLRVLARGYAVPLDTEGRVLKRRSDFSPDQRFHLRVVDGDVPARVEQ